MTLAEILAIPEAGVRTTLDPGIYVEPKDRNPSDEEDRQAAFVAIMRRCATRCLVAAIPNGARRTRWEVGKAKREGLYAGFPDTTIYWADGNALVEFKGGRDMPSPHQVDTLNWLYGRGHRVAVCRTAEGAMIWLRSIGAPVPEVRR